MVNIICCVIICFGMALLAAGIKEGLAAIQIRIVFPRVSIEKERARLDGDYKFTVEQRIQ